ncbi:hypothetical protein OG946_20250 [Streptomyces sp. NBC_01808]|uniref:hypothetical protein n=1 Tax=Streptomyces sp. NBC_01808 TaxID=2975947 RepID=UPI002DD7A06D|nr:hypothetical protein [Streptomyces sp. NBC_01808]WSA39488.1 hypothetical protein OG946_20250 [Streptomyces sp. NBC_01808]
MTHRRRPAPAYHARHRRREAVDILLARATRRTLSTTEVAALAEHVREEQRAADAGRASLTGTTHALERNRAAADAAIREMEQRALDAEEQLTAYRAVLGPRPLDTIRAAEQRAQAATERAEKAEEFAKFAEAATTTAEQRLDRIRTMADAWTRRLPATIRTATAADAVRRAANGDDSPVVFGITADPDERGRTLAAEQQLAAIRRYVDAAYEADMCEGVRGDLRRLLDGKPPTYAAPTDPDEPIPYQLADPAPTGPAVVDEHDARGCTGSWEQDGHARRCADCKRPLPDAA